MIRVRHRTVWLAMCFVAITVCLCVSVNAQEKSEAATQNSSEVTSIDAESALRRITGTWYDVDSGDYRPPVLRKPIEDKIRNDGWLGKEFFPKQSNRKPWTWGGLGLSGEAFGWAVLIVMGTILLFGIILIAYNYLGDSVPAFARSKQARRSKSTQQRSRISPLKSQQRPMIRWPTPRV